MRCNFRLLAVCFVVAASWGVSIAFSVPPSGPKVEFVKVLAYVGEGQGDGTVTFAVRLAAQCEEEVTVQYKTEDGTASSVSDSDFEYKSGSLIFPAYSTADQFITINIKNDGTAESLEEAYVTLSNVSGPASLGSKSKATFVIIDDDNPQPTVQFETTLFSVAESVGTVTLKVTLSDMAPVPVKVYYATKDGPASYGAVSTSDYDAVSSYVEFALGETSKEIPITIAVDNVPEGMENFTVELTSASGAALGTDKIASIWIFDDDSVTVQFGAATYSVGETSSTAVISVWLSTPQLQEVKVDYSTSDGSAVAEQNYWPALGTVTFAPGETTQYFSVSIIDDYLIKPDYTVNLALDNAQGAQLVTPKTAVLTIVEVDIIPIVQFDYDDSSVTEVAGTAEVTAYLSAPCRYEITVDYATSDDTAVAGTNYVAKTGTLTFSPGSDRESFLVDVVDDLVVTSNLEFNLALTPPTNATIGTRGTSKVTIIDVDAAVTVQFDSATYAVSENGGTATIWVTLSAPCNQTVKVSFETSDGSAIAGTNYVYKTGELTFAPGEVAQAFEVDILDDFVVNSNRTVNLALVDPPENASLGSTGTAVLTLIEADVLPIVEFARADFTGYRYESPAYIFVRLSAPFGKTVEVKYSTSDGSGIAYEHYMPANGTLIFDPLTVEQYFEVEIIPPSPGVDPDRTVNLKLADQAESVLGLDLALLTIVGGDGPKAKPETRVIIDQISTGWSPDKKVDLFKIPLNSIKNPAAIVIEANPDMKNVAVIEATKFEGKEVDWKRVEWSIKNVSEDGKTIQAGKLRAAFLAPPGEQDKNLGKIVYVHGVTDAANMPTEQRIRLEVRIRPGIGMPANPQSDPVGYYEAWVVPLKECIYRINLLKGKLGTPPAPTKVAQQVHIANIYLRQIGVILNPDLDLQTKSDGAVAVDGKPGMWSIENVPDKLLRNVTDDDTIKTIKLNANKNKAIQVNYIRSYGKKFTTTGVTIARPASPFGKEIKLRYTLHPDGQPDERIMELGEESLDAGAGIWGLLMCDSAIGAELGSKTLAHEVGHVLNLKHRGFFVEFPDALANVQNKNLMDGSQTVAPPVPQDLDLIQLRAARASPLLKNVGQ